MKYLLFLVLISCAHKHDEVKKPLGANQQQSATQEAAKGISNPAAPPTVLPPAGTPMVTPTVYP